MPNIPVKRERVGLPSVAGMPGTGLNMVNENMLSAPFQAMRGAGEAMSNIADLAVQRVMQHAEQDKALGQKKLILDIQSKGGEIFNTFKTAENPQQVITLFDQYFETDNNGVKRLKELHTYGDDLSMIDTEGDPVLSRYKKLSLTDRDKAVYDIDRKSYITSLENSILPLVSKARFDVFKETTGLTDQNIVNDIRNGIIPFQNGIDNIVKNYSNNGYPESVNAPLREAAIQATTKVYLEDEFDKGNIEIINDVLKGTYNDELTDIYKNEDIVNSFMDKARKAQAEYAANFYSTDKFGYNLKAAITELRKNEFGMNESQIKDVEKSIRLDHATQATLNQANNADYMNKIQANIIKAIRDNDFKGAWKIYDSAIFTTDATGQAIFSSESQRSMFSFIETSQKAISEGINPFDNKNTDMAYLSSLIQKANNGEIQPGTIHAQPYKLSIDHAELVNKVAEGIFKDVDGYLKREIAQGKQRILKAVPMTNSFVPLTVKRANEFEADLLQQLSKAKNADERKLMLTPGTKEYIIDNLIESHTPRIQDIKDSMKEMKERIKPSQEDTILKDKAMISLRERNIPQTTENISKTIEYLRKKQGK